MYEQMIHCDIILVLLQIQRAFRAGNRTRDPWDVLVHFLFQNLGIHGPEPNQDLQRNQGAS